MKDITVIVREFSKQYHDIIDNKSDYDNNKMPGNSYFINNNNILVMPRDDGECRYPYGEDGFNFWTYSSGYMHCNEGLFSPFIRAAEGAEPKIAFFAGINDKNKNIVIPLLSVPVIEENEHLAIIRYTIFTMGATYYITEYDDILFAVRAFVDKNNKIYFTIVVINDNNNLREIFISSYLNPFLKNAIMENSTDRWFRQVSYIGADKVNKLGSFVIETYEELDRSSMKANYGIINRYIKLDENSNLIKSEITTSRYRYVGGVRRSLHTPSALYNGTFGIQQPVCTFTETAIAGDIVKINVNQKARIDLTLGYCFTNEEKDELLSEDIWSSAVDNILYSIEKEEKDKQARLKLSFSHETKDSMLKPNVVNSFLVHLKKQVEFCSVIKGYIQLSSFSLIGIRDVFQAVEGLLYWQPKVARNKMLEALNFIAPNGRCPRQYSLPKTDDEQPAMDLRPFIDQGVWVISTIVSYLKFTGDFDFLNERCGYYNFINDKTHIVQKSHKESNVLQHLFDIMNYLLINRDYNNTKCVCALYGDWNDALDGLGVSMDDTKEYGTGVSVMASLQVYQNLNEMIELLQFIDKNKYTDKIQEYKKAKEEIEQGLKDHAIITKDDVKKIVHGWGDDKSYYVGSFDDPDGVERDGLTSNAFWVLSGLYDQDTSIESSIIRAFARLDSKYGLKTFEPYFEKGIKGVGRIPNLPAGTAENGAPYIHASMFGIMALFRMGCSELAFEQLIKSLPITHEKISCSPYIMPNSYGYNKQKFIDGESMHDWQTGSSNVLLKIFIKYIFGFQPEYEGIWIQPAKNIPFQNFELTIFLNDTKVVLHYENKGNAKRKFFIDNIEKQGVYDYVMKLNKLWIDKAVIYKDVMSIKVID
ncbi:hypothetical protein SH1V18_07160 [Vallitalea longa]|uniref:Glycosyl hydrolase 36 catalytic domain-containing protein n=1 Tax=Vallitalea longa TaxID=2936439 RepID=A0A9W5Y8X9_9FIRM|nr:hypothetical protein [Vallitalea longa]GKX28236.1 hypothetical protein SH1V18_07160 [Vallitalea longa]